MSASPSPPCACPGPGPCPRRGGKAMPRRWWQFCAGTSGLPRAQEAELLRRIDTGEIVSGPPRRPPCRHLGPATGDLAECPSCNGHVRLKVLACRVHGSCTPAPAPGHASCQDCTSYAFPEG